MLKTDHGGPPWRPHHRERRDASTRDIGHANELKNVSEAEMTEEAKLSTLWLFNFLNSLVR
jgi:hypothetical protein